MKRLIIATLLAVSVNVISPFMPYASAASLEDILAVAGNLQQNGIVQPLQELIRAKEAYDQGDKAGATQIMVQTAMQHPRLAQLAEYAYDGGLQGAETAVRQQVEQRILNVLSPYEQQITLLSNLAQTAGVYKPGVVKSSNTATAPQQYSRILDMTATAYGPGPLDNGKWNDKTYMGGTVAKGVVAVDPAVIPMGTKLWVEGYGYAVAEDQGSAIKGNRIDLAFNTRQEALNYGIKKIRVFVLE